MGVSPGAGAKKVMEEVFNRKFFIFWACLPVAVQKNISSIIPWHTLAANVLAAAIVGFISGWILFLGLLFISINLAPLSLAYRGKPAAGYTTKEQPMIKSVLHLFNSL